MMSECARQFNIFTHHVIANVSFAPFVSTTVDVPYPDDFTHIARPSQSIGSCNIFQNKVVTLNSGNFADFDDTLISFVWLGLCFAFMVGTGSVPTRVSFSLTRKALTLCGNHSCSCFDRNSVVVNWILNNWLRDCVIVTGQILLLLLNTRFLKLLQSLIVRKNFEILQLVRTTFVNFQNFAILRLVHVTFVNFCLSSQPQLHP